MSGTLCHKCRHFPHQLICPLVSLIVRMTLCVYMGTSLLFSGRQIHVYVSFTFMLITSIQGSLLSLGG